MFAQYQRHRESKARRDQCKHRLTAGFGAEGDFLALAVGVPLKGAALATAGLVGAGLLAGAACGVGTELDFLPSASLLARSWTGHLHSFPSSANCRRNTLSGITDAPESSKRSLSFSCHHTAFARRHYTAFAAPTRTILMSLYCICRANALRLSTSSDFQRVSLR